MFPDIDIVFFGGKLCGNAYLAWVDSDILEKYHSGASNMYGMTLRLSGDDRQTWIGLNATALLGSSSEGNVFMKVWACLLHEMWYVCC